MTIIGNIEGVTDHFKTDGLTRKDYLRVALKQSSLFAQKPGTTIGHINLVANLYRKGLLPIPESFRRTPTDTATVLNYMLSNHSLFSLSDDNFALREIYARVTQSPPSQNLLRKSRKEVEDTLAKALGHADRKEAVPKAGPDAEAGTHARNLLLRALVREGMVQGRLA